MEKSKPQFIRKVKLKLEQPHIMCHGRKKVECHYRGVITFSFYNMINIKFKSYGKEVYVCFENGKCITEGWEDLVIVEQTGSILI